MDRTSPTPAQSQQLRCGVPWIAEHECIERGPDQADPEHELQWTQEDPPPNIKAPESMHAAETAQKAKDYARRIYARLKRCVTSRRFLPLLLDFLLLGATSTYAYFAYWQMVSMNGQLKVMSKSLREVKRQSMIAKRSADAAKTGAEAASLQASLAERPWLRGQFTIMSPLTFDKDGAHVTINMAIENTGRSVATAIDVVAYLVAFPFSNTIFTAPLEKQVEYCEPRRAAVPDVRRHGFTLFPNEGWSQNSPFSIDPDTISHTLAATAVATSGHKGAVLMLLGCIDYRFAVDLAKDHQTGFMFEVVWYSPKDPAHPTLISGGQHRRYPLTQLKLVPHFFGGNYVD